MVEKYTRSLNVKLIANKLNHRKNWVSYLYVHIFIFDITNGNLTISS